MKVTQKAQNETENTSIRRYTEGRSREKVKNKHSSKGITELPMYEQSLLRKKTNRKEVIDRDRESSTKIFNFNAVTKDHGFSKLFQNVSAFQVGFHLITLAIWQ